MPTHTVRPDIHLNLDAKAADQAALGMLTKLSARKRFLIRVLDLIARPLTRGWDRVFPRASRQTAEEVNRILVVEYWNLGDIVMLTPFLRSLRIQ